MPRADANSSTLVVIPALNESESIAAVIADIQLTVPTADIVVVDDGSTDATAQIARDAGAIVLSLPYNLGVGGALRAGFRYAVRNGYDHVVQTDADGQHTPTGIPALLAALDRGADLVIGSRFVDGDDHYAVDATRGLAMSILRTLVRMLTGQLITDCTSGFRAFSGPLVQQFANSYPREFLSDTVEALLDASYGGFRIEEVSVQMSERAGGVPSHRSIRLGYHYVRLLVVMGLTVSLRGRRVRRGGLRT